MTSSTGERDALERWCGPLAFGVVLAVALVACFPQVLLGTEFFYSRDIGVLGYPTIAFQREMFWRGELPLWNPYSNCGQPFLAQWGTMALYPGALLYLLLPLPWSLGVFCLAHVWLGGMGMYFLARRWTGHPFAAAAAGTTYVFNGILLASFAWPNYLVTLGWMPLVVLCAERAWREGGRWCAFAALCGAMQMLSGVPEVILLTWIIIGLLWLCDVSRAPGSAWPLLRRIVGVVLLVAGLAAVQLLPFFELLTTSHRDTDFATDKWQVPVWGWANFLVPLYNAFETPSGQYFQYSQAFLSSVYLGGFIIALAVVAWLRWPDARMWVLTLFALLCLLMSFGDGTPVLPTAREWLPFLGVARYPAKFLYALAFILPLVAACGMAAVIKGKRTGTLKAAGLLVLLAMGAIAWAAHGQRFVDYSSWPENFRGNAEYSWRKTEAGEWLPDGLANTAQRAALFAGALALALLALRAKKSPALPAFGCLALLALDAATHTPRQNPTLPARLFTDNYWPESLPKPKPGEARVLITPEAEGFLSFVSSTNAQRVWEFKRRAEWSNLNLLDAVPKVNGAMTLQTREQRMVEQALYTMTNRLPAGLLDFLAVNYTSRSNAPSEWTPRTTALPFVTAGAAPQFVNDAEAMAALTNVTFDPRRTILLPADARAKLGEVTASTVQVSGVRFSENAVAFDVESSAPALVSIAQSYHPNWTARVNGEPTALWRANVAFQALLVPAGKHHVALRYQEKRLPLGGALSAGALLLCLVVWWRSRPRADTAEQN